MPLHQVNPFMHTWDTELTENFIQKFNTKVCDYTSRSVKGVGYAVNKILGSNLLNVYGVPESVNGYTRYSSFRGSGWGLIIIKKYKNFDKKFQYTVLGLWPWHLGQWKSKA